MAQHLKTAMILRTFGVQVGFRVPGFEVQDQVSGFLVLGFRGFAV